MSKEQHIEDILNSLDGIRRAEAGPFLYNRILARVESTKAPYTSTKWVWLAAASFALLVLLNLQALRNGSGRTDKIAVLAEQYQIIDPHTFSYGPHE